ncbi:unnamed protein product [Peniophora sp. CBMAI 1063]|nr:unnamed protein product [Peniophora sp. CBMAI 1063]
MAPASHDGQKKLKKPPTFQHLPEHRAKKLKKEWVEKQKIQSKWKAQKKREGIVTLRDSRKSASTAKDGEEVEAKGVDVTQRTEDVNEDEERHSPDQEVSSAEESDPKPTPVPTKSKRRRGKDVAPEEEELSYRELQRRAYSRDSLHHHKSGRGTKGERGPRGYVRGAGRGSVGWGRGNSGRGNHSGRGGRGEGSGARGGQPDMRLRMSALLEKIKHDVAS